MQYYFRDNQDPNFGRVTNGLCEAVGIVLDIRELPDTPTSNVYHLHYPPIAILVRPLENAAHTEQPVILPVFQSTRQLAVSVPHAAPDQHSTIHFKRTNIPLACAYTYTDFFVQGMTYRPPTVYLTHMQLPPHVSGAKHALSRESIIVMTSRYTKYSRLLLLTPLWPQGDTAARNAIIDQIWQAADVDNDQIEDMERLQQLAQATQDQYSHLLQS